MAVVDLNEGIFLKSVYVQMCKADGDWERGRPNRINYTAIAWVRMRKLHVGHIDFGGLRKRLGEIACPRSAYV